LLLPLWYIPSSRCHRRRQRHEEQHQRGRRGDEKATSSYLPIGGHGHHPPCYLRLNPLPNPLSLKKIGEAINNNEQAYMNSILFFILKDLDAGFIGKDGNVSHEWPAPPLANSGRGSSHPTPSAVVVTRRICCCWYYCFDSHDKANDRVVATISSWDWSAA
jgi:hypothetical protein